MTRRKPDPPTEVLRDLAVDLIRLAREREVTRLVTELEVDGVRVEVIIARLDVTPDPGEEVADSARQWDESVTVKAGAKSGARTIIAGPADWLIAAPAPA